MNALNTSLIVHATHLVYKIPFLSNELKVYWSKTLDLLFRDVLSKAKIQFLESEGLILKSAFDYKNLDSYESHEEALTSIALVKFLTIEAEKNQDYSSKKQVESFLNKTIAELGLEKKNEKIQELFQQLQRKIADEENKPEILIPANNNLLYIDFVIRCLLLSTFSYITDYDNVPWFWFTHFLFLPIIIFTLAFFAEKKDEVSNKVLFERFGGIEKYKIKPTNTASQYTFLTLMLITGASVSYLLSSHFALLFSSFIGLTLYYTFFLKIFTIGRVSENSLITQNELIQENNRILEPHEIEENIVRLESDLKATTSRLETYVFESALFGALTFGGFLQIMAENLVSFQDLELFAHLIYEMSFSMVHLDFVEATAKLNLLNTKTNLFCLVSMETLFCSILFLGVIASRLRYSDVADGVRHSINVIKINNQNQLSKNEELTEKISAAQNGMKKVLPIVNYMRYFRMAGILTFQVILISSSFFVSNALAIVFVLMGFSSFIYFNQKHLINRLEIRLISARNLILNKGARLVITSLLLMVLALFLRTVFQIDESNYLILLSLGIFGIYALGYFLLIPHHDDVYAKDNEAVQNRLSSDKWKLTISIIGFSIALFSIGLMLKILWSPGANQIITIPIIILTFAWIIVGYHLISVKLIGILSGFLLSIASFSILFKILRLPGTFELFTIFVVGQILVFFIFLFKKNIFHKLYLKISLFFLALTTFIFIGPFNHITTAYQHRTISINEINKIYRLVEESKLLSESFENKNVTEIALNELIDHSNWYLEKYGQYGYTQANETLNFNFYSIPINILQNINEYDNPKKYLEMGLKLAQQNIKIGIMLQFQPVHHYINLSGSLSEPEILIKLERPDEARLSLNNILKYNPPEEIKEKVTKLLEEIDED